MQQYVQVFFRLLRYKSLYIKKIQTHLYKVLFQFLPNQQQIFDIFGLSSELTEPVVSVQASCAGLLYVESVDIFCSKIHEKFEVFPIQSWFPAMKTSSLRHFYSTFTCVIITSNRQDAGTNTPVYVQLTNNQGKLFSYFKYKLLGNHSLYNMPLALY